MLSEFYVAVYVCVCVFGVCAWLSELVSGAEFLKTQASEEEDDTLVKVILLPHTYAAHHNIV